MPNNVLEKKHILSSLKEFIDNPSIGNELLENIDESSLAKILKSQFEINQMDLNNLVAQGECIFHGDVSGQLVLDRELGEYLLQEAENRKTTIDLIYSCSGGNLNDFNVLESSKGFFTNDKGRTTFCPVQASCEGIPTIIGVPCALNFKSDYTDLIYMFNDNTEVTVKQPKRSITFTLEDKETEVIESKYISMNSANGKIYKDELITIPSKVSSVCNILTEAYLEALKIGEPKYALKAINHTNTYKENKEHLLSVISNNEFQGFQKLVKRAMNVSKLKVFSTAHTSRTMILTKLITNLITISNDVVNIEIDDSNYGLGLLRDERMWHNQKDIDLMRILFLGEDAIGTKFENYKDQYLNLYTDKLYDVFKVGTGEIAVVRILCMPLNMIFSSDFDIDNFIYQYDLPENKVKDRIKAISNETETYHGSRGVRITVQREDICKIWCKGLIEAAKRASANDIVPKIQILLSMVTFPQEVKMFLNSFESLLEENAEELFSGISIMMETSGAYHLAEDIFKIEGRQKNLNGMLFGGNDFTAACLNMNRADSATSIIPEYINNNIMPNSPFNNLNEQIVGKAILQTLHKLNDVKNQNKRDYLVGLGGEIAGDWTSLKWLTRNASSFGLDYVTTSPDRILFSLFASAQASLQL